MVVQLNLWVKDNPKNKSEEGIKMGEQVKGTKKE